MSKPSENPRPLLIVSLEGFATSAIGCYGSSWNATPTIDQIAANGCVWDRWITTVDDPTEPICQLLKNADDPSNHWTLPWQKRGSLEMVTDVAKVAAAAKAFDGVTHLRADPTAEQPATEIDETHLASIMAAAIQQDAETDGDWSLMWLHTDVLTRCWDAPRALFPIDGEELSDDSGDVPSEDSEGSAPDQDSVPPIMPTCDVPQIDLSGSGSCDRTWHPDIITSWMRTYGCQIRLLDLMLEVLLPSLRCENPRLMLMGTSGFSLGQNGWVGHRSGPLRSHDCRLPLIISDTGPVRMPAVTADRLLATVLAELGADPEAGQTLWCGPQQWIQEGSEVVIETKSDRAQVARTTPHWYFVQDADHSEHLFLKPDDVDDFNDVARLRTDVVESLSDTP